MAKRSKTSDCFCLQGSEILLMGVQTVTTTTEICVVVPEKVGIYHSQDIAVPLLGIYTKDTLSYYRGFTHEVFRCFILNMQKLKANYISLSRIDKENDVHLYVGVFINQLFKKRQSNGWN